MKEEKMDDNFKLNIYFNESGDDIEKIISNFLISILDKNEYATKNK